MDAYPHSYFDAPGSGVPGRDRPGTQYPNTGWSVAPDSVSQQSAAGRPGLLLVLGAPNSGKLGRVVAWWRKWAAARPFIVAPRAAVAEAITLDMVQREVVLLGAAQPTTFDGLVRELLGYRPPYVGTFHQDLILAELLRGLQSSALGSCAWSPGLLTTVGGLLRRFGESGRTPEEMAEILEEWARREPEQAGLAADVQRLVTGYAAACATRGLVDRNAAVLEACAHVDAWGSPVAFYGFTSFTAAQRRLIETLAGRVPVLITFDHERGRLANLTGRAEVDRWERLADHVKEMPPQTQAYSSPAVAYLERHFMDDVPPAAPVASNDEMEGVRFLLASGERSEAELTAQHVMRLIQRGFRPGDIAVVVRRTAVRGRLLSQVFDSCAIPYRLDVSLQLAETGLGHAFLQALGGIERGDADALLAYLHSPYSGLTGEQTAEIELRYRRGGVRDSTALAALVDQVHPGLLESVRAGVGGGPDGTCDVAALRRLALGMLKAGLHGARLVDEDAETDVRAYRALTAALAVLQQGPVEETAMRSVPTETLLECLRRLPVPRNAGRHDDAVAILSPARARARRFAVVFILGLVEGEFPGPEDVPSLLTETQKRGIEAVAGEDLLSEEVDDEAALFLSACSRPWQLLYLSARDADDGGGEVTPSHFWIRARDLLGDGAGVCERRTLADVVFADHSAPALRHYRRAGAVATRGRWRRTPAALHDPAVLEELATLDGFSPSALERYLVCPFAWFLERIVGVEERTRELDGRVVGTLFHTAVSRVYRALEGEGGVPLRPEGISRAVQLAATVIDELLAADDCPGTAAEKRIASWRIKKLSDALFAMEGAAGSRLRPAGVEVEVGGRDGVDIGGLRVRGRIDRIDTDPEGDGLFVIDYKTGRAPSADHIGTAEALQLPLYLLALQAERPGVDLLGGAYLSPAERKRSGFLPAGKAGLLGEDDGGYHGGYRRLSPAEFDDLCRSARDAALQAASGIRAGAIAPLPDRSCPSWCAWTTICRAARGRGGHR